MIRVLLVDDHRIFTEGVASLMLLEEDFQVVGQCQNAIQVKEFLPKIDVDVIVLDVSLGKDNGIELCKFISSTYPAIKILACSMHSDESLIIRMMKNGASGYILKNTCADDLLKAIRIVSEGKIYQSNEVMDIIWQGISRQKQMKRDIFQIRFTNREKEIMELVAMGKTTRQIAQELLISEKTVEGHRTNLFLKLEVKNVAGFMKKVMDYGFLK